MAKAMRDAGGDAVQHIAVDPLGELGDGVHVADAAQRTQRADDLVFHAAVLGRHAPLRHLYLALAGHQTGVAGAAVDQNRVRHGRAGDGLGVLEGTVAEVVRGQNAVARPGPECRRPCRAGACGRFPCHSCRGTTCTTSLAPSRSSGPMRSRPRATMAFRFLLPITAPKPARPWKWRSSLTMAE